MRSGSAIAWALASTGPERSKLSFAVSPSSARRAATATGGGAAVSAARAEPASSVMTTIGQAKRRLVTTAACAYETIRLNPGRPPAAVPPRLFLTHSAVEVNE